MTHYLAALPNVWRAENVAKLPMPPNSFVIYSESRAEDRANVCFWRQRCKQLEPDSFAVILDQATDAPPGSYTIRFGEQEFNVNAFDLGDLVKIVPSHSNLIIDISGVDQTFWAGCMVEFRDHVSSLYFIYTEPGSYKFAIRSTPERAFETGLFDLSDRSRGVSPLPRFANLHGPELYEGRSVFVPLLGFEGRRALNVLSGLDPTPPKIVPIVGVPGYRLEFPTYSVTCNEAFFSDTRSASKIRYAAANDPFEVRDALREVGQDFPDTYMYVAPIGTRPHTVGALMFANEERERAEILFDHPIRKFQSRQGMGNAHLYRIF